jgi:Spy/CpxP family protein refolding chaperone
MKTMKKIFVTVFAVAFSIVAVQAQEIPERKHDGVHRDGGKKRHGKQMENLNLSEEQKTKLKALNEAHQKEMADLGKKDNISVRESREKKESLRKDHMTKVQGLLTPEQKAQVEKNKEDRKAKMQEMEKSRGERMKKELNLTDEQSAKLDANKKEMSAKMKSLRDDKSLTEEQKRAKSKELRKQQMESMKSVLTDEQMKKMKEGKKRGGKKKATT